MILIADFIRIYLIIRLGVGIFLLILRGIDITNSYEYLVVRSVNWGHEIFVLAISVNIGIYQ